jgi:KDO2-lipid IV(A) lauroyltransferase
VLDRFVYWMFRLTILVMRPLPLRLAYRVAAGVAVICAVTVFRRQRRALRSNLARVLPSSDAGSVDAVARQSFRNFGKFVVDFIHYPVMTREEVKGRLRFDQFDDLNMIAASGRGAIIVTLHFGTWDLGGAALAALDYKINAVAEVFPYPPMDRLVRGSRERLGMRVIGRDRAGSGALRALRRGELLAMLIDVTDETSGSIEVDFFGAPARVATAPARLALRTGAWAVPSIVVRGPDDDLIIRPYIDASLGNYRPSGNEDRDVRELTSLIMASLERHIRAYPDQWFMFQPLWTRVEARSATVTAEA